MTSNEQRELEEEMRSLDDHQLLRLVAVEAGDYQPEALRIARDELHRRRVDVLSRDQYWEKFSGEQVSTSRIMNIPPVLPNTRKAVFGWLSLFMSAGLVVGGLFVLLGVIGHRGESNGMDDVLYGVMILGCTGIPAFILSRIGVARRETPRWPAIVSLVMSLVSLALVAIFFLLIVWLLSGLA
jgi:hypothetical protein